MPRDQTTDKTLATVYAQLCAVHGCAPRCVWLEEEPVQWSVAGELKMCFLSQSSHHSRGPRCLIASRREERSSSFQPSPHYARHFRQLACERLQRPERHIDKLAVARLSSFNSSSASHISFSLTSHLSDQSGQSHFQSLFEAAFRDYEADGQDISQSSTRREGPEL